ncbi:MAG: bifunctional chorismate mutase/prephenate dehydratase [Myxococcota bacterium]
MGSSPTDALLALRRELDEIDGRLVATLAARQRVIDRVALAKESGGPLRDRGRERSLLNRLLSLGEAEGVEPFVIERIYRELIDHSVRRQQVLLAGDSHTSRCVAYQGGEGAFSHSAARRHFAAFGGETEYRGFRAFRPMLESVQDGDCEYAVLPIENTIAGSINESYDLLDDFHLFIVGEEAQPVVHHLIGLPGASVESLTRVYSHPVALLQCRRFLGTLTSSAEAFEDTALAVAKVKAEADPAQAAIASEDAANVHDLPILVRGVQDEEANLTRMVVVARQPRAVDPRVPCKTSVVFSTQHRRGALARSIALLAEHEINLTKLESRPLPRSPFEYRFYLDFEGNPADLRVQRALDALALETSMMRVLGTYPAKI